MAGCDGSDGGKDDAAVDSDVAPDDDAAVDSDDADVAPGDSDVVPDTTPDVVPDTTPDVEVVDGPGLGIDYGTTAAGATPRWDPTAADWMAVGWPSDRWRDADGHVHLANMPRQVAPLLDTYMDFGDVVLNGWGLNGAVYFEIDGAAIDLSTLPSDAATTEATSPIQLVDVTRSSASYGQRLPLVFQYYNEGDDPFYSPHTLAMRPVYGFPLVERDTYCAIVTRATKDAAGNYLQQAPAIAAGLDTEASLAPLVAWLPDSHLARKDIAVASCFTAQDATGELDRVARFIDDLDPPELDLIFEPGVWGEFHGLYTAPNFQAGDKPYQADGDIRFDERGDPIVQADEEIRFLLLTPTDHDMPEAGWPVTLYAHGTGGDYESCRSDTRELVADGIAVLCIDQPLHGPRGPAGQTLTEVELVLYSFNFVNPYAGRSNFRQAAIDSILLSRMIEADRFQLPADQTLSGQRLSLDPDKIYFYGHSHGGLSGTLAMAVDPRIKAGIISGMSGVIVETILLRKDPADLASLAASLLNIDAQDLDSFHPALNLMQMLVDATDPINYTRYWLHPRSANVPAKNVFVTQGTMDAASPSVGNDAATAAGGVPQIHPIAKASRAHELRGMTPVDLPVKDNVDVGNGEKRTVAMRAWQGGTHFVAFDAPDARAMWRHFIWSAAYGDGAEIGTGDLPLTRQEPVAGAWTCEEARAIPNDAGFPINVRGNTRGSLATFTSDGCGPDASELATAARDVWYRFTAPAAGTYRFRVALQPAVDRDHPRFGPDVVAVLSGCGGEPSGAGGSAGECLGRVADGSVDLALAADQAVIVVVSGTTPADVGPFNLVIEQRCQVLDCGARECGAWGCGNCGSCDAASVCDANGQCVPRAQGDTCASAIEVSTVPFVWSGDTRDYLNDGGYGATQCPDFPFGLGATSDDVTFAFTPPLSGLYKVRLDGDYDTNLWVAQSCSAATCLGADRTGFRDAEVVVEGTAGETLYVVADGTSNTGNSAGHATLQIDVCVPDCNDKACGDDGCGGSCGTCPDGGSCVTAPPACAIPDDCPEVRTCEAIPGDRCESAFVVGALPWSKAGNTAGAQSDYGVIGARCATQPDGSGTRDTWGFSAADQAYKFTAPKDGLYRFGLDTGNPVYDASLYVASDCGDIEATCLGADERDKNERVWVTLDKDETVYAIVDGWVNFGSQSGKYTLDVRECVPSCENKECGDDGCAGTCGGACGAGLQCQDHRCLPKPGEVCWNPRGVGRLPWQETLTTVGYGADQRSACEGAMSDAASPDTTYYFEAPADETYRFTVTADFAAQVYVDAGCDDNGRCLAGGVATAGGYVVDRAMAKGEHVFVTIDGADMGEGVGASGAFTFRVAVACDAQCTDKQCGDDGCGGVCGTCAWPTDVCQDGACIAPEAVPGNTCAAAFEVGALPFSGEGDTREDAWDDAFLDEGQCGGYVAKGLGSDDQVWHFTAPEAGDYLIEVAPDGFDAYVFAIGNCEDPVGTCYGADDGRERDTLKLTLGAGEPVFIVVDGEDNVLDEVGAYRIDIRRLP